MFLNDNPKLLTNRIGGVSCFDRVYGVCACAETVVKVRNSC